MKQINKLLSIFLLLSTLTVDAYDGDHRPGTLVDNDALFEVCQGREYIDQLAIENDEVVTPLFESENICISKILDSKVAAGNNWYKSEGGVHEYAIKYKFHRYVAQFEDGKECIDTYVDDYSQNNHWKFKDGTDIGTRFIVGVTNYTVGLIGSAVEKFERTVEVNNFMNDHRCQY
jgi:hypothetical protein|tara:strand:- start:512 stop:1036 length:525 start_codon:yes stop_codon:yes gene_type:complete